MAPRPQRPISSVHGAKYLRELTERGHAVIYARKALYPALEMQVVVREVSREELGALETAVLGLAGEGVERPEQIARLLGMPAHRLQPFLDEFIGRGMLRSDDRTGRLWLSETGKLCTQHGRAVVDVWKAVLLCGLTGQLMPNAAYKVARQLPADLKRTGRSHLLMVESQQLPLSALDLRNVPDKAAVNFSDETQAIVSIDEDHQPVFLPCFLALHRGPGEAYERADAFFPDGRVSDLPVDGILPYLEPLGFDDGLDADSALDRVCEALERAGAQLVSEGQLDRFGNPRCDLRDADDAFLKTFTQGRPLAYYLGTSEQPPLPIPELWTTQPRRSPGQRPGGAENQALEVLGGHALSLSIESPEGEQLAKILRRAHDVLDTQLRPHERRLKLHAALRSLCSIEEAIALARRLDDRPLLRALDPEALS